VRNLSPSSLLHKHVNIKIYIIGRGMKAEVV
jgi:hypothetical protein